MSKLFCGGGGGGVTLDIVGDCKVAGGFSLGDGTSADTCTITGTAYFYGGYTLASGSSLTVGNMPTLNPVTTTAPFMALVAPSSNSVFR